MAARAESAKTGSAREDLLECLAEVGELGRGTPVYPQIAQLLQKSQELIASITEAQFAAKDELLALKEENLGLRRKVWETETQIVDPLEAINARIRLEEIVRAKDEEIAHLKETNEVDPFH